MSVRSSTSGELVYATIEMEFVFDAIVDLASNWTGRSMATEGDV
jgi:hypothetical protein